ncbi:beta strand repeat-containing protein [Psychrosphaera algicola]|uniref:Ig-like domain-containing protein n=1 Tax=Psychrosphaera algicola TaxID=3023714 RepID=A0ABT5FF59_9GAMM|nr:Ig-like domain-containing protein [Psychrosphaera sp. G1-22]MDC2890193.1 Ig-like domain-containing protein [Psychrosphaera sp. G1-22]
MISNTGTLEIPNGATLGSTARITVAAPKTTNSSVLVTDSILVTVLPPVLDTLTISSSSSSVPRGTDISLSVSGMLSDNGLGIPTTLEWSSSNTSVATVSSVGVVSTTNTAAIGSTVTITARAKKEATSSTYIVDQYELTIAAPLLDTIDIVQPDSELGLGLSLQLTITGLLSDGTSDSPSGVIWSSSNTDTATVDSNGVVSVLNATTVGSQALITAKAEINPGSGVYTSSSMTITVINAALETISLSATNTTVPVGTTQQVVAVGSLSNGTNGILTSQIWSSSDTDTATVNSSGLVTFKPSATAGDTFDIELRALAQAGSSTYISGNITLTVGDPILSGIEITTSPPTISRGTTLSITAIGTLTNNNNGLPTPLTWSSSNTDVATVDTNGVVTIKASASVGSQAAITVSAAVTAGSSVTVRDTLTVTAGQARLQSLTLAATETDVPVGTSQQISVAALLSDGSTTLSTAQVWSSADENIATVNSEGLVTFKPTATVGDTVGIELKALELSGSTTYITDTLTLTVGEPILSSIEITTAPPTISRGTSLDITAMGTLTDNNNGLPTTLTWTSSNTSVATVDNTGEVTILAAASVGSQATITVTAAVETDSSQLVSDTVTVTAGQARLQSLTLSATETDVPVGTLQQIAISALLSDGSTTLSTSQVWSSADENIATVSNTGLVSIKSSATAGDTVGIELKALELSGSTTYITDTLTLTVGDPILSSIEITTAPPTISRGTSLDISAMGTLTDNNNGLPTTLTWTSSNTSVATVDNTGEVTILAAASVGSQATITVTAAVETDSSQLVSDTVTVTAGQARLQSLTLSATETDVPVGTSQQISVAALLSDGGTTLSTAQVWSSADENIATVNSEGLVTFKPTATVGDTVGIELKALELSGSTTYITDTLTLTVGDPILSSIEITTAPPTISRGTSLDITAMGTLTDNNNGLPTSLTWTSSNTSVATVDNTGEVTILAAASVGSQATITVTAPVETDSSQLVSDTVAVTTG